MKADTMQLLLRDFEQWAQAFGPVVNVRTAQRYARIAQAFAEQVGHPAFVGIAELHRWVQGMRDENLSASTINQRIGAIKAFLGYAVEKGMREDDPARVLRLQRRTKLLPTPVSHDVILSIVDHVRRQVEVDPWAMQDVLILELLYGSGLRRAEAATLVLEDVKDREVIGVVGKGDKERETILTAPAFEALVDWVVYMRPTPETTTLLAAEHPRETAFWLLKRTFPELPVFYTRRRVPLAQLKDPGHYLWKRVRRCAQAAGAQLPENDADVRPHKLRHSFVTELLNNGAALDAVAMVAGHESLRTTQGYTKRDRRSLRSLLTAHSRQRD